MFVPEEVFVSDKNRSGVLILINEDIQQLLIPLELSHNIEW
jgi:hypothetical protein